VDSTLTGVHTLTETGHTPFPTSNTLQLDKLAPEEPQTHQGNIEEQSNGYVVVFKINIHGSEAKFKEKQGVCGPTPELTI
jgi:hypothetical protein